MTYPKNTDTEPTQQAAGIAADRGRSLVSPGDRFGRLVVLHSLPNSCGFRWAMCICDCGQESAAQNSRLLKGRKKSCGCQKYIGLRVSKATHGEASHGRQSAEYIVWGAMKSRCLTPEHADYSNYGARGISVCDEWIRSFGAFLSDMGRRPTSRHTLDRIDNERGYQPDNCRWATYSMQNRNTRGTVLDEDRVKLLRQVYQSGKFRQWEVAEQFGISRGTVSDVTRRHTWSEI